MNIVQLGPGSYALDSRHEFFYNTGALPTPQDVIDSLTGIPRILSLVPSVLKGLDLAGPYKVEVYVSMIEAGSLRDNIITRLIFGSEAGLDKWISLVRKKTGVEYMNDKHPIITPVFAALVGGGLVFAAQRMAGREGAGDGNIKHLRDVSNSFINTGAITLNVAPEDLRAAVGAGAGNFLNLATNATRAIAPAKRAETQSPSVQIDGLGGFVIDSGSIKAAPSHVDRSVAEPVMEALATEDVSIRALDVDNLDKGWFIIVPRLSEKRLPLEVAVSVNPGDLQAGRTVNADIEVYYTFNDKGDRVYRRAYLRGINK